MSSSAFFPYDLNELVGSRVRFLIALTTVTAATKVSDVINVVGSSGVYAAKTGWIDVGGLAVAPTFSDNITQKERTIQNDPNPLLRRVDQRTIGAHIDLAELSPENLAYFTPGATIQEIAAATGHAAMRHVNVGSSDQLPTYRAAFIGMLDPSEQGTVQEGSGGSAPTRGRFVGRIIHRLQVAAGNNTMTLGEDGWTMPVDFEASPDPDVASAQAEGFWFEETAGTIATS